VTADGTESVLFSFGHTAAIGAGPTTGLIMDGKGNLYGTTEWGGAYGVPSSRDGTVFELTPQHKESALWNFGNGTDGYAPTSGVVMDVAGNLYGTTSEGGAYGQGIVFELTPPQTTGGSYTESILWNFGNGSDGANPVAGLYRDARGNLYGTTFGGEGHLATGRSSSSPPRPPAAAPGPSQSCGALAAVATACCRWLA